MQADYVGFPLTLLETSLLNINKETSPSYLNIKPLSLSLCPLCRNEAVYCLSFVYISFRLVDYVVSHVSENDAVVHADQPPHTPSVHKYKQTHAQIIQVKMSVLDKLNPAWIQQTRARFQQLQVSIFPNSHRKWRQ